MYSFEPSDEQKMLVEAVNRYALNNLRAKAHDMDEENHVLPSIISKGWELGYLQASIPEQYGGFGDRSAITGVLTAEELSWGDLAGALAVLTPNLFAIPILLCGSQEQKEVYLPRLGEADWQPYSAALIEPSFDFDPLDLHTIARLDGNSILITGKKTYVPYADQAPELIVYANFDGQTQGFILSRESPGLRIGERQKLLGIHALPVYDLLLDEVRVPVETRIGGIEGHHFTPILNSFRLAMSALAVGLGRAALEYASDYAKEREVFGVKVAQKQAIAFMIAEMATEIEAVRLLTWEAAWMADQDRAEASKEAYLAHTAAIDMAMMVTDRAVQILGGHGYIREHPVELWMRNGRGVAMLSGLALI